MIDVFSLCSLSSLLYRYTLISVTVYGCNSEMLFCIPGQDRGIDITCLPDILRYDIFRSAGVYRILIGSVNHIHRIIMRIIISSSLPL